MSVRMDNELYDAAQPVAWLWQHSETGRTRVVMPDQITDHEASWFKVGPLVLGAAPPAQPVGITVWINPRSLDWLRENPAHRVLQTELRGVPVQGWVALYTAPQASQPLTADQVFANNEVMAINAELGLRIAQLMDLVRAVERAHGIGAQP